VNHSSDQPSCKTPPLVSVVLINWNGTEQISKCFDAVLNMDFQDYEVIFVDNGSDDESLELARSIAETSAVPCRFIDLGRNAGVSEGKNIGAEAARGKYIWHLDNDIAPDSTCLSALVRFLEHHPDVGLCGPSLHDFDVPDKPVGGGYFLRLVRQPAQCTDVAGRPGRFRYVSFIGGAVMFMRRSVWAELGGFEASYLFWLDDNDFGPRCWNAGHKVALLGGCNARHYQISRASHAGFRWRFRMFGPAMIRRIIRNYTLPSLLVAIPAMLGYYALKAMKNVLARRDPRVLLDAMCGFWSSFAELPESLRQRRRVQAQRVVSGSPFLGLAKLPTQDFSEQARVAENRPAMESDARPAEKLGHIVKRGATWTIAARFAGQVARLLAFFALARILGPKALGAVGVIYVLDAIGSIATQLGLSTAIIQRERAEQKHIDSAMFVNLCAGAALALAVFLLAPALAAFFDNPLLAGALAAYSLVFLMRAPSYTPEAILRRGMRFRAYTAAWEVINVVSCVLMVGLAFGGAGVWSVVCAEMLRAGLLSVVSFRLVNRRIRPRPCRKALAEMFAFSGWSTIKGFAWYGLSNVDYIIVGRMLGGRALGLYVLAFRLISQPLDQIGTRLHEVIFPAFSRFKEQGENVARVYKKLACAISVLAFPLLAVAAVLADEFFEVAMGPAWRGAVLPFQIMCLAGVARAMAVTPSALATSQGHVKFEAFWQVTMCLLLGVGSWIGSAYGIGGVAVAANIAWVSFVLGYVIFLGTRRLPGVTVLLAAMAPAARLALAGAVAAVVTKLILLSATQVGDAWILLIGCLAALAAIAVAAMTHRDPLFRSVLQELGGIFRRKTARKPS
jgi:O-antigen/teichoic acid export membrane protein/GT2 family glycosyltransferase